MAKGKSPGSDGLSAEFYLAFWESLGQDLVESQNYAFECGELTISQRRGIITLIPMKNKDKTVCLPFVKKNSDARNGFESSKLFRCS